MRMNWKKFKKERVFLSYTVMLLPHSQKKPIHFKIPVWVFGAIFLGLFVLTGTCLFFAGSRYQLEQVRKEKEQLELEWTKLAQQKQQADQENEVLRQEQEVQEQELKELEARTRNARKELEELAERESQIRQELGLEQPGPEEEISEEEAPEEEISEEETPEEEISKASLPAPEEAGRMLRLSPTGLPVLLAENTMGSHIVRSELDVLQSSLAEKNGRYEGYLNRIEEQEAAAAAEKARKEALRAAIVTSASYYIGNAYVYGGNNPNTGVDCSGFTKYILGNVAGVYLNRTAAEQAHQGRAVAVQEARPGDLVFYSNGSNINHVAIYAGDGQVVHASNERVGIVRSNMYYRTPVKVVNVLGD